MNPLIHIPDRLYSTAEFQQFEGMWDAGVLVSGPDEYRFSRPLAWSVTVSNTGGALLVAGTVKGRAETDDVPNRSSLIWQAKWKASSLFLAWKPKARKKRKKRSSSFFPKMEPSIWSRCFPLP